MIKQLDDELYEVVCSWWDRHGFARQKREYIPPTSFVSFIDDKPVFFASFYHNCGLGFILWYSVNPDSDFEERETAFNALMAHIDQTAKGLGVFATITPTISETLLDRLTRNGFKVADRHVTHLFKEI